MRTKKLLKVWPKSSSRFFATKIEHPDSDQTYFSNSYRKRKNTTHYKNIYGTYLPFYTRKKITEKNWGKIILFLKLDFFIPKI